MSRPAGARHALYWDASALLSALVRDRFSRTAISAAADRATAHLISSLAVAEVHAVLARLARSGALPGPAVRNVAAALSAGPWRLVRCHPDIGDLETLAVRHPLRGADLWHLAAAADLAVSLPGLRLLTFDARLREAAVAEGLA